WCFKNRSLGSVLIAETHRTGRPVVTDNRRVARHSIAAARHKPGSEAKGLANGCNIPQALTIVRGPSGTEGVPRTGLASSQPQERRKNRSLFSRRRHHENCQYCGGRAACR